MESYIAAFLTPILTALIVWAIERDRDKRDAQKEEAEKINRRVNLATMELAYATAIAVEKHKTNGELKKAKEAYKAATDAQNEFNRKLQEQLMKK